MFYMNRDILFQLENWKEKKYRKPLVLKGARQVGKTYILKQFGEKYYKNQGHNFHYVDLRENRSVHSIFQKTSNPAEIIKTLQFSLKANINPQTDLLILDEIQECPGAITSLKYFEQDMKDLAIISAGSHLGMTKNEESFPVGKVNFLYMFPMTYSEFVMEIDIDAYQEYDNFKIGNPYVIPDVIHERLLELFRYYLITGGLPEVVEIFSEYIKTDEIRAINEVRSRQRDLIEGYKADFSKYSGTVNANHIHLVFESIPYQLSKAYDMEVSKYIFKGVIPNQKGFARVADPLNWLFTARLCLKSLIANQAQHPLKSYCETSKFKIFMFDIGILNCALNTPPEAILTEHLGSYKGYLAENFVAQELYARINEELISWQEGRAEIEFLVTNQEQIIPLEVKSSIRSRKARSLDSFISRYQPQKAFKVTGQNYGYQPERGLATLPIYLCSKVLPS